MIDQSREGIVWFRSQSILLSEDIEKSPGLFFCCSPSSWWVSTTCTCWTVAVLSDRIEMSLDFTSGNVDLPWFTHQKCWDFTWKYLRYMFWWHLNYIFWGIKSCQGFLDVTTWQCLWLKHQEQNGTDGWSGKASTSQSYSQVDMRWRFIFHHFPPVLKMLKSQLLLNSPIFFFTLLVWTAFSVRILCADHPNARPRSAYRGSVWGVTVVNLWYGL